MAKETKKYFHGVKPDHPSYANKDYKYRRPITSAVFGLPKAYDNTSLILHRVYDQGAEGCHDSQTEVLTDIGWFGWPEFVQLYKENRAPLLATVNPETKELQYQQAVNIVDKEYQGKLYKSNNQSLDFALTPNHRMYVRKWNEKERTLSGDYSFVTVENLGWYSGLLQAPDSFKEFDALGGFSVGGTQVDLDDFCAFLGILLSDGWVREASSQVGVYCFKESVYDDISELMERLPFSFKEQPSRKGSWLSGNKDLWGYLNSILYDINDHSASGKKIPTLVQTLSPKRIGIFLDYFCKGDGCISRGGKRDFYTTSKAIADGLQELILKIGRTSVSWEREPRDSSFSDGRQIKKENCKLSYVVSERKKLTTSLQKQDQVYTEDYSGRVYCAEVPNSILITRRNGKILISGNSCVANASVQGAALSIALAADARLNLVDNPTAGKWVNFSRRWIMAEAQRIDPWPETSADGEDGTDIRSVLRVMSKGIVLESTVPYIAGERSLRLTNTQRAMVLNDCRKYKLTSYRSCMRGATLLTENTKSGIKTSGSVVIAVEIPEGFYDVGTDGVVPTSSKPAGGAHGYHALALTGWEGDEFIGVNSWDQAWGKGGSFRWNINHLAQHCYSAWVMGPITVKE